MALTESHLWGHLTSVLQNVLAERPSNPVDLLEFVSDKIATGRYTPLTSAVPGTVSTADPAAAQYLKYRPRRVIDVKRAIAAAHDVHAQVLQALSPPEKPPRGLDDEDEDDMGHAQDDAEAAASRAAVPDFLADAELFRSVGVGLPEAENLFIAAALRLVAARFPVASVRFWGKLLGDPHGYYVVEATPDPDRFDDDEFLVQAGGGSAAYRTISRAPGGGDGEEDVRGLGFLATEINPALPPAAPTIPPEPRGVGTNRFLYYAASTASPAQWFPLPLADPSLIAAARDGSVRTLVSGDPTASVPSVHPFPGLERDYVRVVVARVTHGTTAFVRDAFVAIRGNDDEAPVPAPMSEEMTPLVPQEIPDSDDTDAVAAVAAWASGYDGDVLMSPSMWVHGSAPLGHAIARCTYPRADNDDEAARLPPPEVIPPVLQPLSDDGAVAFGTAWSVRRAFHLPSSRSATYVLRSLRWPGAYTVAVCHPRQLHGAMTTSVYIGDGRKTQPPGSVLVPEPPVPLSDPNSALRWVTQHDITQRDRDAYRRPATPPPEVDPEEEEM
eukprot:TRINITY_DN57165_c0_g1_i1.p1 TRINITY_DN57165_c0_g1~~TRINITY_DN57165_c0_g1_i1.p1  ORF type:complete len:555 (+),score=85.55 TRINITY_DN57165_c0_g1_i1:109-1773(+)